MNDRELTIVSDGIDIAGNNLSEEVYLSSSYYMLWFEVKSSG